MEHKCYLCGNTARLVQERREVPMGARRVTIDDEFYRCAKCGETFTVGAMGDETLRRAAAAVRREDGLLTPQEIRELRAIYGLSQANLEKLINSGEKTVVRWERGTVAQNATADTLLRVLRDHPEVVAKLAEQRGVPVVLPEAARSAA
ncbi:MAG TPA: type II TA system antitoxin MqsA family protein [Longimicrobium sp.]|jgi:HTH-type transcriptional regulator/antitoxin MqsA|nr:type II TA system antitoxin MqsA family protein [Longimicrobium sp.]